MAPLYLAPILFFIRPFHPQRNTTRVVLIKTIIIKTFENVFTQNLFNIYYPSLSNSMINLWHPPTLRTIVEVDEKTNWYLGVETPYRTF